MPTSCRMAESISSVIATRSGVRLTVSGSINTCERCTGSLRGNERGVSGEALRCQGRGASPAEQPAAHAITVPALWQAVTPGNALGSLGRALNSQGRGESRPCGLL